MSSVLTEDPGTCVALLWDTYESQWTTHDTETWSASNVFEAEVEALASQIRDIGVVPEDSRTVTGPYEAFLLISAIDRALTSAHPKFGDPRMSGALSHLADRVVRTNRLDIPAAAVAVVWSHARSNHLDDLANWLTSVRVVSADVFADLRFVRPKVHDRISPEVGT